MKDKKEKKNWLIIIEDLIVKWRYVLLTLFIIVGIWAAFNINKVDINYEISSYLPSNTETKMGLQIMQDEFGDLIELELMVNDIDINAALELAEDIKDIENVASVNFLNNDNYYKDNTAFYLINLKDVDDNAKNETIDNVASLVENKDYNLYDASLEDVVGGINIILACAIIIIVIVLLFTSKSYFDIILAFIIFGLSTLINMGTNFIFGEISYITQSIAVILQLALSLDYLIIFLNHYHKEINDTTDEFLAVKKTISKSMPEIFASSLTTIAGLMALIFMQLKIGADIGMVLAKGIVCSLLTVILVLPSLLVIFRKLIKKFEHNNFIPDTLKLSKFIVNKKNIILPIFLIALLIAIFIIPKYDYVYDINTVSSYNVSSNNENKLAIDEKFGDNNQLAILIPTDAKYYNKELLLAQELLENEKVIKVDAFGSQMVGENVYLGTKLSALEFAQLFKINESQANILYNYYASLNNLDSQNLTICLMDILQFLYDNNQLLDANTAQLVSANYSSLMENMKMLESTDYTRIIVNVKSDVESDEAFQLVDDIRGTVDKYYNKALLVGDSINALDLKESFTTDNTIITIVTIVFILIILLFTFKSLGLSIILVLAIEGSILINFALITLLGKNIFFISYVIVSAIQMGATIDYAIVISNRYMTLQNKMDKKEALVGTLRDSITTVITSGIILIVAGFLIGFISDSGIVSSIGMSLGLGTLISILITIFVLPAILYVTNKIILKTTFKK